MAINKEQGQVAIIVALASVAMVAFLALTLDVGYMYAQRRLVQGGADSGALAGAYAVASKQSDAAVEATVLDYLQRNGWSQSRGSVVVSYVDQSGQTIGNAVGSYGAGVIPTTVLGARGVRVAPTFATDSFFAGVIARQSLQVSAASSASYGVVTSVPGSNGIYPIIAYSSTVSSALDTGSAVDIWEGGGPGNFGWLRWPDDGNGTPDFIAELTPPGTAPTVSVGDNIPGRTGVRNSSGVRDALSYWVNAASPMTVLVWDTSSGGGSNLTYHVAGITTIVLQGYDLDAGKITARVVSRVMSGDWSRGMGSGSVGFGATSIKIID